MAVSGGEDHWKREQERERDQSIGGLCTRIPNSLHFMKERLERLTVIQELKSFL